jgi:putative DNA primase/helicase
MIEIAEVEAEFISAAARRGVLIRNLIANGHIQRCDAEGRNGRNDAAYLLHLDGRPAGGFENHRDGLGWENWRADLPFAISKAERRAISIRAKDARRRRDEEQRLSYEAAAKRAEAMLVSCEPADPSHPYLIRKGIKPHGILQLRDSLVVPVRTADSVLQSLQFIREGGSKCFLKGGRTSGCGFRVPAQPSPSPVRIIAEGFATAATLHEATGSVCYVAYNARNLKPVAEALRHHRPDLHIIIASDDDWKTQGNPGITSAWEAAAAVGGVIVIPRFGSDRGDRDTDFNDVAQRYGLDEVREQLLAVTGC